MTQELRGIGFPKFGGLRLDLGLDEVGPDNAIFLRDVDWDGSIGRLRSRDGFAKLKASEASGEYKGLFPHSSTRLLVTKRIEASSVKLVAIDRENTEKAEKTFASTAGKPAFARYGTPSTAYTYCRAGTATDKVIRFNGSEFTEPTATVDGSGSKEMPRAYFMQAWPDARNRMVFACTGSEGGPNKASSSSSHVWFSKAGSAEEFESTAYVQLSPGDGEEIQGMCLYGGQIFVFKETKLFVFTGISESAEGKPEFDYREISLGEGSRIRRASLEALAESSDQICAAGPDGVYFATSDGIYVTAGGAPSKISEPLKPLEEAQTFQGPMANFLSGAAETFRWPASGLLVIGTRLYVKRYEFIFKCELTTGEWLCDKMTAVSMCAWVGLTGGGVEGTEKGPSTAADDSSFGVSSWENINNIKTKDETGAKAPLTGGGLSPTSHYAKATNFGITLPTGAIPVGIKAVVRAKGSSSLSFARVRLVKGGVIQSAADRASGVLSAAWTEYGFGESSDLWSNTFSKTDVESSGFGVAVAFEISTPVTEFVYIDYISLSVYYTVGEATSARPRVFCTQGKFVYYTAPGVVDQAGSSSPAWQSGFYDLGLEDEKTLEHAKIWGSGTVSVAVAKDFGEVGEATSVTPATAPAIGAAKFNKSQTGSLFSHRISGSGPWSVQRLIRYLRETRVAATKTR